MNMEFIQSIMDKVKNELESGLPFMEGREKSEVVENEEYTITDFGMLKGDDGEYVAFICDEESTKFFFGGQVLTEKFSRIKSVLNDDELKYILSEKRIKVTFEQKTSSKGRNYTNAIINLG